jgi:hypothetical protein
MSLDASLLPPVLRGLVEAIGFDLTLQLLRARGGQRVHIPVQSSAWLLNLLGPKATRILCERWGGQELDLPKHDKIAVQLRNAAIRADRETHSLNALAARYGLTRRHILNVARTEDDGQPDLFGP